MSQVSEVSEANEASNAASAVDAPIAKVTVLEDRAVVTRVFSVPAGSGQVRLVVPQVSPLLVDKSLRAVVRGGQGEADGSADASADATAVRVLDVRCVRAMAPWRAGGGDETTIHHAHARELIAAVTAAKLSLEKARIAAAAARDDLTAHAELRRAELTQLAAAAARGETGAGDNAEGASGNAEVERELASRDEAARSLVARITAADEQVIDREEALRDAEAGAAQAGKRAGVESAHLEIDCLPRGGGELALEYMVPAAAWRPFHRAHLDDKALRWEQGACIWQRTGEDWEGVELALSAERASLGVEVPELDDDLLDVGPKPSHVQVQSREQEIEHVGLGEAARPAGEPQVMGIDDGGLGLSLSPKGRCTVRSDGRPHRVFLESFDSEAELALLAIPLRSPLCHVRARFDNRAKTPILSGPVDLVRRSGFIGRTDIDFISAGERAELGFGSEAEVRVHREQHEEQEESSLLGGWTSKTVRVVIRLSNLGTAARQVLVQDRVPVSEIEQVVINVAGPEAYLLDKHLRPGEPKVPQTTARAIDDNGIVSWTVPLPARGRAAVALEYKVKSQRGVSGI